MKAPRVPLPPVTRLMALAAALALLPPSARAETVSIANSADWASFATRVNAGEEPLDAVLTADVALTPSSPRVGSDAHPYKGDFNGGGHCISVNWTFDNTQYAAPFAFVGDGSIHDLRVIGTINSSAKFAAGLIGSVKSNTTLAIERCRVSVSMYLTMTGEAAAGGIVGIMADATSCKVTMRDCLFDGSLRGTTARDCGGFVGWKPGNSYLYLYNSLFAPGSVTLLTEGCYTFSRSTSASYPYDRMVSCYYTQAMGRVEKNALDASSMAAEALAAALGANWAVSNGKAGLALFPDPSMSEIGFAYQGSLRDAQGQALSQKELTVEFRLYGQPAGGEPLWGRAFPVLLDDVGLFNVALSDGNGEALSDGTPTNGLVRALATHAGTPMYFGITVAGSGAEISPRQKLLAVPVASVALDAAATSGGLSVTGNAFAGTVKIDGATSAASLDTTLDATVGGNLVVGGAISGLGAFPVGGIVIWHGSVDSIPDGWKLCNGQNGTPDLRDRFVVGAGNEYAVGETGGEKTHRLNEGEMPRHRHEWVGDDALLGLDSGFPEEIRLTSQKYDADSSLRTDDSRVYGTSYVGGGEPHENRPPYYALCYIMRVR